MNKLKGWLKLNYKGLGISIILIVVAFLMPSSIQFSLLLKCFSAYLGLFILISVFPNNKFFNVLKLIIGIPYFLMISISPIHLATISILFTIVFSFGIPALIILIIEEIINIELTRNTIIYLGLTIGSMVFLLFGNWLIKKNIEIIESNKPKSRIENQIDLTLQILNQKTYRLIIYSIFLILLFMTSVHEFQNAINNETIKWTRPILQSFVTIVAFDRIIQNSKQLKMSLTEVKNKFIEIYKTY